jgi:hypothetical protein
MRSRPITIRLLWVIPSRTLEKLSDLLSMEVNTIRRSFEDLTQRSEALRGFL